MQWTKRQPLPPTIGQNISQFYWYKEETTDKEWIIELWPGRDIKRYKGMWSDRPIPRPEGVAIPPPVLEPMKGKGLL